MGILSKRALGRRSRLVTIAALIAGMMLIAGVASAMINDIDDINVEVPDRTTSASATMTNAIVWYYGDQDTTHGSAGTGVIESFVRLQAKGTESGYNTDGALELDTKAGKWTHSIKVSEIPTVEIEERLYWEFFADINEDNKKPKISLNEFELWVTGDPNLTGYAFGSNATQIYDFTGEIKINDVNQGSGR
ncbi:MAG: hypothetical protein U9R47_08345, partial [Actinomycetota bacterium]|nr:hypothetical protein [Actinomycetota bacterium]